MLKLLHIRFFLSKNLNKLLYIVYIFSEININFDVEVRWIAIYTGYRELKRGAKIG